MNVVVVGCGRVGSALASTLSDDGHSVTIMDLNSDAFRRLPPGFPGSAIIGNGIDEQALRRANIEFADMFVALTQGDNRNLMSAQIAKHIFKVPRVMARVYDQSRAALFGELGLETISSTRIISGMVRERMNSSGPGG